MKVQTLQECYEQNQKQFPFRAKWVCSNSHPQNGIIFIIYESSENDGRFHYKGTQYGDMYSNPTKGIGWEFIGNGDKATDEETKAKPVPRKRGRPRKVPVMPEVPKVQLTTTEAFKAILTQNNLLTENVHEKLRKEIMGYREERQEVLA